MYNGAVIGTSPIDVNSEHFTTDVGAEDLQNGDEEFVQWAGEYRLMQRLERRSLV